MLIQVQCSYPSVSFTSYASTHKMAEDKPVDIAVIRRRHIMIGNYCKSADESFKILHTVEAKRKILTELDTKVLLMINIVCDLLFYV